jgi:hypothetical protein
MKREVYKLHIGQTFEIFCNEFKEETGETLFNIADVKPYQNDCIALNIPESNVLKITQILKYGKCNIDRYIQPYIN